VISRKKKASILRGLDTKKDDEKKPVVIQTGYKPPPFTPRKVRLVNYMRCPSCGGSRYTRQIINKQRITKKTCCGGRKERIVLTYKYACLDCPYTETKTS